jgi:hypothetical protein
MKIHGFIYEWTDTKTGLKYIGRHEGNADDGYTGSGTKFLKNYKERPHDFTRIILWEGDLDLASGFQEIEDKFLNKIPNDELFYGKNKKYYNIVRNSRGYTSENNPMKNPEIVAQMMETSIKNGTRKNPWQLTVEKYGLEEALNMARKNINPSIGGKAQTGIPKSPEHRRRISEAIKEKYKNGSYSKPPGRKKIDK